MINYEWDIETIDEHGDVLDHNHADKLAELPTLEKGECLVLVRDEWDGRDLIKRTWAYVEEGKLPKTFQDAEFSVPEEYHQELGSSS